MAWSKFNARVVDRITCVTATRLWRGEAAHRDGAREDGVREPERIAVPFQSGLYHSKTEMQNRICHLLIVNLSFTICPAARLDLQCK